MTDVKCSHCGFAWKTNSSQPWLKCPHCKNKTRTDMDPDDFDLETADSGVWK